MHEKEPVALLHLEDGPSALKPIASPSKLTHRDWKRVFSSQHTLFSSTLAPGKSGGKALTSQLQCRGDCTTEADTSLVTLRFYWAPSRSSASGWDVLTDVLSTWFLPKSSLRARVPLKRTLLSVHVFFHNWMCWSPKLLFLPKLLHSSKLQHDISSGTSGGLSKTPPTPQNVTRDIIDQPHSLSTTILPTQSTINN